MAQVVQTLSRERQGPTNFIIIMGAYDLVTQGTCESANMILT